MNLSLSHFFLQCLNDKMVDIVFLYELVYICLYNTYADGSKSFNYRSVDGVGLIF